MSVSRYIQFGSQQDIIDRILGMDNTFVVVDKNVFEYNKATFAKIDNVQILSPTEQSKTLQGLEQILDGLCAYRANRHTVLVAIGGGIIGDMVGFAASMYMRGIEWINIPTTLLAQVDSSIGGKTAVNYGGIKNLLGCFYKPKQVIIDPSFLATLGDREWLSGVGEIVKTALLNKDIYELVRDGIDAIIMRDMSIVRDILQRCVEFKDKITTLDYHDKDIRRILNLGHTLGHALETLGEYELPHGEYVLQGIFLESGIFADEIEQQYLSNIRDILKKLISFDITILPNKIAEVALRDKKNLDQNIHLVLPKAIGEVREVDVSASELIKRLKDFVKINNTINK